MLPKEFYIDLLDVLKRYPHLLRFRNFESLKFDERTDVSTESGLRALYDDEYNQHRMSLARDTPCDVYVMHDTDSGPAQTLQMATIDEHFGVPSTISTFARVKRNGQLEPYSFDFDTLVQLQRRGFSVGYHTNAYENADFDEATAAALFEEDVAILENHGLQIKYFSPHGGRRAPDGAVNGSVYWPALTKRRLIWTHNFHAPLGARYSDGAASARLKKADPTLDLRAQLIANLAKESRYFILIHPQYYFYESGDRFVEHFAANPWLAEYWQLHKAGRAREYWQPLVEALDAVTKVEEKTGDMRRAKEAPVRISRQKKLFDPPYRYIGIRMYRRLKARLFHQAKS